ncbi:MAG: sugar phosphate isomerase/epimerase [Candidatus Omnitrophica bacterium]|nr:sugar phosphate isomerase/epimerase [Candidatus Omnitrophota bacterium]
MMSYTMARGLTEGEKFNLKALCELTRELNLDGVDWISTYGYDAHEIRKMMDDYGLKTVCHTFFCDLNFPTSSERASGRDTFKRGIENAKILGTDKVMLPVPGKQGFTREWSFKNVIQGLNEVIKIADEADIIVTIENSGNPLSPFITSTDVNRAVKEIPQLRITFDNGNVTTGGQDAVDGFRDSAQWVVHAHFKDWKICTKNEPGARLCLDGKYRRAVLVGDGDVEQVGCINAMKEYGYKGYINFEYEGQEFTPRQATIEGVRRMKKWIAQTQNS